MKVLLDHEGERARKDLEEAWTDRVTFAFLPSKSQRLEPWATDCLARLPDSMRTDHFALLSSGTTGDPKLVLGSRVCAESLARLLHEAQESEVVSSTIGLLPLSYSYAFVNQWLWARTFRREFVSTAGFAQPDALGDRLERADRSMTCLVAAHVPLFERHFTGRRFPGVLRVHFAGSRFPQEKIPLVRSFFPEAEIYNNYGCIEAMPRLALRRAEEGESASDIGRPLPGVELFTAQDGRLLFRSPYAAVGFCDSTGFHPFRPEDWIFTGDAGHPEPDGHWRLDGRASEIFKRYGEKISLPMLLDSLAGCWPGHGAFYRETDSLGETGHVLVLAPHPDAAQLRAVLSTLRRDHPRTHWPLRIESASDLPLLPNGKVDPAALTQLDDRRVCWSQRI